MRKVILAIVFIIIGTIVYFAFFRLASLSEPNITLDEAIANAQEKGGPVRLTFAQCRQWDYRFPDRRVDPPEKLQKIRDREIAVRGFMFVTNVTRRIRKFSICQFCYGCCFRGEPAINEFIEAVIPPELDAIPYKPATAIWLKGKLEWGEKVEGDFATSIYRMVVSDVNWGQSHRKGAYTPWGEEPPD